VRLFEGFNGKRYSKRSVERVSHETLNKTNIDKILSEHSLWYSFTTHMLENGEDVRKIPRLLDHKNIKTTEIYTHVSSEAIRNIRSPLDNLDLENGKK